MAELEKEDIRIKIEDKTPVMSELNPQLLSTSTPVNKEVKQFRPTETTSTVESLKYSNTLK